MTSTRSREDYSGRYRTPIAPNSHVQKIAASGTFRDTGKVVRHKYIYLYTKNICV